MALSAHERVDRAHFSRIFSGLSLAHRACAVFSEAAHGKRFGALPPCFEFTRDFPASGFRYSSTGIEKDYAQACVQYEDNGSLPPAHLLGMFRINAMVCGCAAWHLDRICTSCFMIAYRFECQKQPHLTTPLAAAGRIQHPASSLVPRAVHL